jgi:2-methylisocitrate lyase-like PEP mutase family enzyme
MVDQNARGSAFRELHERPEAFVIPNPFDAGSARILTHLGFEALATSSAGHAFTRGLPDYAVGRNAAMAHLTAITAATDLPVTADLENGFADRPEGVADTVTLAVKTGVVGASIEDATGKPDTPLYPLPLAADRIRAAAEVARSQPFPFTLTARAENFLVGKKNLRDAITRLQAYQEAGADVLFAPGLTRPEDIAELVRAVDRPVNVVTGFGGVSLDYSELSDLGVKRISVGSALARTAYGAIILAAREMRDRGSFSFADEAISYPAMNAMFECPVGP